MDKFKEYIFAVANHWWALTGGIGAAIVTWGFAFFAEMDVTTGGLGIIFFFTGISIAQFLAWKDIRKERDNLIQSKITEGILTELGNYRRQLISHQNITITSDNHLESWIKEFLVIKASAVDYIKNNISTSQSLLFRDYGTFKPIVTNDVYMIDGGASMKHIQHKSMIIRDCQWLADFIDKHSVHRPTKRDD